MDSNHRGQRHQAFFLWGMILVLLFGAAGCYSWEHTPLLTDPTIQAGPTEAFVKPTYNDYRRYRIAILPFRVPAVVTDVGYSITEVFQRQLLQQKPFLGVVRVYEYSNSMAQAQKLAKKAGTELFLLGEVPSFLDSGTMGKSGLQVDLRVVETKTGRIIWYLSDTISAEPAPIYDLWVTETRPKPSPSIYFLVETLAVRMCTAMKGDMENPAAPPPPEICGDLCPTGPTKKK